MEYAERCRERSEACKRKAEAVSDVRDRAKWLELADGWIGLSRIPFHPGPKAHFPRTPHSGFWRDSECYRISIETKVCRDQRGPAR